MSEQREQIRLASSLSRLEQRSKGETLRAWSKSKRADLHTEQTVIKAGALRTCTRTCTCILFEIE